MVVKVIAYKNTGLAFGNCLDDSSLLDTIGFPFIEVPDVALKQTRGIVNIRLAVTWDDAKDIDYIKIDNSCYWVLSIEMLNDNVASVNIMYDAITSIGVANIETISGWCTRRTLSETEDSYYGNTIDEPFTPTERLNTWSSQNLPDKTISETPVVLSTVDLDLDDTSDFEALVFEGTKELGGSVIGVAVPKLPELKINTAYVMVETSELGLGMQNTTTSVAGTALFDLNDVDVRRTINYIYSISAENTILDSYMLPNVYFDLTKDGGMITGVSQNINEFVSGLAEIILGDGTEAKPNPAIKYYNKKVYSGQFMQIQVTAVGSGNSVSYRPEDILPSNGELKQIKYYIIPDGRYNGVPTLVPSWFRDKSNEGGRLFGSVTGAEWQRAPFTTAKTGVGAQRIAYNTGRYVKDAQQALNLGSSVADGLNNFQTTSIYQAQLSEMAYGQDLPGQSNITAMSIGGAAFKGITNVLGSLSNMTLYQAQANTNRKMLRVQDSAKDMHFLNAQGLISYFGNIFIEMITGLSSRDMTRFDTFLTAFGYAVSEPLAKSMFTNNQAFDYIQANDLNIKGYFDNNTKNSIIQALNSGVRIWHRQPVSITAGINREKEV